MTATSPIAQSMARQPSGALASSMTCWAPRSPGAAAVGTFLGLDFDLSEIHTHGRARFWVRDATRTEGAHLHARRQEEREVHPAPSSKALQYGQLPGAWPLWDPGFEGSPVWGVPASCRSLTCWRPSSVCDQGGS